MGTAAKRASKYSSDTDFDEDESYRSQSEDDSFSPPSKKAKATLKQPQKLSNVTNSPVKATNSALGTKIGMSSLNSRPRLGGIYHPKNILSKPFKVPTFVKPPSGFDVSNASQAGPKSLGMRIVHRPTQRPLHDPEAEGAIILHEPPRLSIEEQLKQKDSKDQPKLVHVVVDPTLSKILRPHQIEGVKFMYDCVTGMKVPDIYGCIMADGMGLGKTLQCITLLWTLLKQSPEAGKPTIEKAVIACPSSLVRNWANELIKWLGPNRIHPLACDNKGSKEQIQRDLRNFATAHGRMLMHPVLIISYETLRINTKMLQSTNIGLLLCDEGHRLKNPNSQTFQALNTLNVKRRVILSGTPIQNDLTEYFALLNFSCPGLLGSESELRRNFENPILRGRDAMATEKERQIGEEKLLELAGIASQVIIRRTSTLLSKYLPIKFEHVVFCKLSETQLKLYKAFVESKDVKRLLSGATSQPLKAITFLKKLCNHPSLLEDVDVRSLTPDAIPENWNSKSLVVSWSGKLLVLDKMLKMIKETTKDKIVLISNYTQTLDTFEQLCRIRGYGCLRLDGTMTIPKRQKLVDQFNNPNGSEFVFLLSSKAGGCGLNLIGANRLVLFDPDWNPASDMQALARVWRGM
ncbi:SNF2 family N-terminal domain-containing protein [Paraphysoderma sedebokerense]|nr:SNF2 family N-terminal domain-containing protein [Paraphysoderma sedebokerense]